MSEQDSPEVQAAIEREHRMWTLERNAESIEGKLDTILNEVTALKERVGTQNGRVGKLEAGHIGFLQRIEDMEQYFFKPLKATVDSIGAQVQSLWESRVSLDGRQDGKADVLKLQWKVAKDGARALYDIGKFVVAIGALRAVGFI